MKFLATRIELIVSVLFLWICEGILWPPIPYFTAKATAPDATDPFGTAMHAGLLGILLIVAVVRHDEMRLALRCSWPILALVALAFLSAFWSDVPDVVLRRALTLAVTTVFAAYIAVRIETPQLVSILVKLGAIGVACSFIIIVVAPKLATGASLDYPNAMRGAYAGKNILGGVSAFGIIMAVYALRRGYGSRLIALAMIPGALVLLYISQSVTALSLPLAAGYTAMVALAFRRRDGIGLMTGFALIVGGLAVLAVLALAWNSILPALNRNPTLTGRVEIWQMVMTDIGHRPWLGFGYGAFWGHNTVEAWQMWQKLYWIVPHAHNAWLEVGLALGIIGVAGMTLLWLMLIYRGLSVLTWPPATHVVFWLSLLPAILIENMTEYEFLKADAIFWVLFAMAFVYLSRQALARKAEEALAADASAGAVPLGGLPALGQASVAVPR